MKSAAVNIANEPFNVYMASPDGEYQPNDIDIMYYKEPELKEITSGAFAYANEDKPVMIETDFFWGAGNDYKNFQAHSNFTCRFTSTSDPTKVVTTSAIMEKKPIGAYNRDELPDQIRCRSPKW